MLVLVQVLVLVAKIVNPGCGPGSAVLLGCTCVDHVHVVDPARASRAFVSVFELLVSVATPPVSALLFGCDHSRAMLALRWLAGA